MRRWLWACLGLLVGPWSVGCGESDTAELGFVLVRPGELGADGLLLRATGLDREHVVRAVCEVSGPDRVAIAYAEAELDPETPAGEQELRLRDVPAGQGYFARILGLASDGEVWECGATGPFDLARGEKKEVTIVIERDYIGEPCAIREDCGQGLSCRTGWPGGYCTASCVQDDCPGRNLCFECFDPGRCCVETCEDASGCRDEYECRDDGDGRTACLPL